MMEYHSGSSSSDDDDDMAGAEEDDTIHTTPQAFRTGNGAFNLSGFLHQVRAAMEWVALQYRPQDL